MVKDKLRVNSFFTGVGGFDLGFEKMGFKITYQCEINSFCNEVLTTHWPSVKKDKDITQVDPKSIPNADIWCGGFPCQDVSVARGSNGRDGLKGKNSGLFYSFIKLIEEKKPEVVLIENVTGLLSSHNGNDFKIVIQSLTNIGYGVSWRIFNTRYFGSPQSRPRVYICAWKDSLEKAISALHECEGSVKAPHQRQGFLTPQTNKQLGISVPQIAYCLAATSGRHTGTDWSRTYVSYTDKVRRLTPSEAEKLQGFPSNWTIPKNVSNPNEILDLDTLRYHSIGNAVSVPVVVWIANRINQLKNKKTTSKALQSIIKNFYDFNSGKNRTQFFSILNSETLFPNETPAKIKWNSGGFAYGDEVIDCKVHSCPTYPYESSLIDLIDIDEVAPKYFISPTAATGIIRRVNGQGRVLFKPLMKSLIALSKKNTVLV